MNLTAGYAIRDDTVLVTARGHERLREELQRMCADGRQEMAEQLRQARGDGTLQDNPELLILLGERASLERRIAEIEEIRSRRIRLRHRSSSQPMTPWCKLEAASIFGIRPAETDRSMSWSVLSKVTSRMVGFRSKRL